ncbi:peptide/nickel transport system substrate-binding protein [Rhizobiales bacterium GAS191]|nr:peptide/nickel transport system substrate-binding protein [Rhizobiales bacterium GAS113]SEE69967.1 peptide/nickel transport system substrate-binding protein [Rhizobiales bacterium GAS191]
MDTVTTTFRLIGRWKITAAAASMFAVAYVGPGDAAGVLTVGNPFAPVSMDPAFSGNGRAGTFLLPAYEPLVRTLPDGSFEPALATSWSVSADNREVTFTLRQDAKFSDGEPVTAAAAKRSIEYWRSKNGPFATNLATATSIDVLEPYKFKIVLSSGNPNVVSLFDAYWLSGDLISPKALDAGANLGAQTFGAGPYKLDPSATIAGKSYAYVPNEFYYDKSKIKWDKVVISVFEDQNSAIQAMKTGQLKLLISDPLTGHDNAASLPKELRIISDPVQWIGLILSDRDGVVNPALKDVRVRQALNYGVDRKLVSMALFGNLGDPTDQLQGKGFIGHDEAIETKYPYDPAKAKALLAEAGYANGLEIKTAYVHNTLSAVFIQALAGQYRKIGVAIKGIESQNLGALANAFGQKQVDALIFNTNSGVPYLAKFQPLDVNGSVNYYHSVDPALTQLIADASALNADKADEAWKKVYAYVADIAWFVPVSAVHVVYFASNAIEAPKPGQSTVIDLIRVTPAQ